MPARKSTHCVPIRTILLVERLRATWRGTKTRSFSSSSSSSSSSYKVLFCILSSVPVRLWCWCPADVTETFWRSSKWPRDVWLPILYDWWIFTNPVIIHPVYRSLHARLLALDLSPSRDWNSHGRVVLRWLSCGVMISLRYQITFAIFTVNRFDDFIIFSIAEYQASFRRIFVISWYLGAWFIIYDRSRYFLILRNGDCGDCRSLNSVYGKLA